jgi:hypothetical protein
MFTKRVHGPAAVSNAAATKYTVPTNLRAKTRHIHVSNTSASPVNFTMSIGADAAGTRIFDAYQIAAGDVLDYFGEHTLEAAEIIQAFGSVNNQLVMTIDVELTPA